MTQEEDSIFKSKIRDHFGIIERHDNGDFHVLRISVEDAKYQGKALEDCSPWERRKFENIIVMVYPTTKLKFVYE